MSSTAASTSGYRGRIVTKNSARVRSITAAPSRPSNQSSVTPKPKHDVSAAKSAGPRFRNVRTTDARLHSDHVAKRQAKISESSHDSYQQAVDSKQEARKKLQRCVNLVRSFVRFTGAKQLREQTFMEDDALPGFTPTTEPTYKLDPDVRPNPTRIESYVQRYVTPMLNNYVYDAESASKYSRALAASVTDAMKHMDMPRYRFVVNVTIGGKCGQAFGLTSRCLWDDKRDNFATIQFKGKDYFIVITVHAVYLD